MEISGKIAKIERKTSDKNPDWYVMQVSLENGQFFSVSSELWERNNLKVGKSIVAQTVKNKNGYWEATEIKEIGENWKNERQDKIEEAVAWKRATEIVGLALQYDKGIDEILVLISQAYKLLRNERNNNE